MADSDPSILYHYCSNSTLVGLLRSKQIWLSDPRFMNDSRELRHAGHIFARTFRTGADECRKQYVDLGLVEQTFFEWVAHISERFERDSLLPRFERFSPFIFCLSEDGDSLSQWRAYGGGHYCIGFDRANLEKRTNGAIYKVAYKRVEFDPDVAERIRGFFEVHKMHVYGNNLDTEVKYAGAEDFESLKHDNYFLKIKDDNFRDEREWRLVLLQTTAVFFSIPREGIQSPGRDSIYSIRLSQLRKSSRKSSAALVPIRSEQKPLST